MDQITTLRSRLVEWPDPASAVQMTAGLSGLDIMQGIRDGRIPGPPMAYLIGFRVAEAEAGRIVMELEYDPSLENTIGLVHGGAAAAMLDTAMGAAAHTMLPTGQMIVTQNLQLEYLRPLSARSGTMRAEGKVIQVGRQNCYVEGTVHDGAGKLAVHAVGNFSILKPAAPTG